MTHIGANAGFGLFTILAMGLAGAIVLLDRVGVPESLVAALGTMCALVPLVLIGWRVRTMRISQFYVAGRAFAAGSAGFASGGMLLALWLLLQPWQTAKGQAGAIWQAVGLGLVLQFFVLAPVVRKSGAFSLPGLLQARFAGGLLRFAMIGLCSAIGALAGLAALLAASHAIAALTGFAPLACLVLVGGVVAAITMPGGQAGAGWAGVLATAVALGALLAGAGMSGLQQGASALPGSMEQVSSVYALWAEYGDGRPVALGIQMSPFVLAAGLAGFAPLCSFAAALPHASSSWRSGLRAIFWSALLGWIALGAVALSLEGLERGWIGQKPEKLPEFAFSALARREILVCGKTANSPQAAKAACAANPRFQSTLQRGDVAPTTLALFAGAGVGRNPPVALAIMLVTAHICLMLGLAALCAQALATTVANDIFYHLRDKAALASRRLAMARSTLLLVLGSGVAVGIVYAPEPQALVAYALLLTAAVITPLLCLVMWPLATVRDAGLALLAAAGLAFWLVPGANNLPGSVSAIVEMIAAGCFATGLFASLFHHKAARSRAFFQALLAREGQILAQDKGA